MSEIFVVTDNDEILFYNYACDLLDKQISFNADSNLFYRGPGSAFRFSVELAQQVISILLRLRDTDIRFRERLIQFAVQRSIEVMSSVNQYYSFQQSEIGLLTDLYRSLFTELLTDVSDMDDLRLVQMSHFMRLRIWLSRNNAFGEQIYTVTNKTIQHTTHCYQYEPWQQLQIIRMDNLQFDQPLLDIGCGSDAKLVHYLRDRGVNAFGVDRLCQPGDFLKRDNWLEFRYGKNCWGTICSHLAFSLHFQHHHLRSNGDFITYARVYNQILHALKPGGSFIYTPSLSFIEDVIPANLYSLTRWPVGNTGISCTRITRLASSSDSSSA